MKGRAWAYGAALLGGAASLAANVAHAVGEGPGPIVASAFWPVALLVTTELITRFEWPEGGGWLALRLAGGGAVAAVVAVVSYQHMSDLLATFGAGGFERVFGPVAVDGLMTVGTAALLAPRRPVESDRAVDRPRPVPVCIRPTVHPVRVEAVLGRPASRSAIESGRSDHGAGLRELNPSRSDEIDPRDRDVLEMTREQLRQWHVAGGLTEYRIRMVCQVGSSAARRIIRYADRGIL